MVNNERSADVIVIGGSLGGCLAALSAAKMGFQVIITEETDWLGGQMTSQGVPPDEHPWIESFGCTATYREFRDSVRDFYQKHYPLTDSAKNNDRLNPGNGWVSRLCHEPKVALHIIESMLAPYMNSQRIRVFYGYVPEAAEVEEDSIQSFTVKHKETGDLLRLKGRYYLDATELGDVLPMAGAEYVIGAESREETGEPHAMETADPADMQSFTYIFALDYLDGEDHTIEKPEQYDLWRRFVPAISTFPLLSWFTQDIHDFEKSKEFTLFPDETGLPSLWTYRRIIDHTQFNGLYKSDISIVNWPQNDYFLGSIIDVSDEERELHLKSGKQLSLSLVYWLQTEAPRPDGGKGYPGLHLRKDILGTEDGLAMHPYIREARRIKSVYTITEKDVSRELRGSEGIRRYEDSVGVGSYHLDLHHTTKSNRGFYIPTYPYEIPLGALLPIRMKNLLPACKNIGTTQVTNGCYRVHPTEWNIGESVGYLAAYALQNDITPHEVRENPQHLQAYQALIQSQGVQIHWPDEIEL